MREQTDKDTPYDIYSTVVAHHYDVYISQSVAEPERYTRLISLFRNASPNDSINVYLNTPGGQLHTGLQLIDAIRNSRARVTTILDGAACSLGPLILFAGHDVVINENGMIMFHNYSGVPVGKGNEIRESSRAYDKLYDNLLKQYARPFLTDDEIQRVINGEDMYFVGDEITPRIERVREKRRLEVNENLKREYEKAGLGVTVLEDGTPVPQLKADKPTKGKKTKAKKDDDKGTG